MKKFLAYSVAAVLVGWSVFAVADDGASDDQTFSVSEWSERGVFVFSSLNFDFFTGGGAKGHLADVLRIAPMTRCYA